MVPLKNMLDAAIIANEHTTVKKVKGTINWLRKKAFKHSAEVRNEMKAMAEHPEFLQAVNSIKKRAMNLIDIKEMMLQIAALHDIGRLAEIDLQNGTKFNGPDMISHEVDGYQVSIHGVDHAFISYRVAQANGITDPLILLPIKYHGVKDLETEIIHDSEFLSLDKESQDMVLLLGHCIRDADKIANLLSYTKTGVKLCGEMNDPDFHGNNDISPAVLSSFMSGETVNRKDTKTYLDTMFKFVAWTYDLHFDFNKERASKTIITPLFDRMREENRDELSDTIKKARRNWQIYEELLCMEHSHELLPELKEQFTILSHSYLPKDKRPEFIDELRMKALDTLNVINNAYVYVMHRMNNNSQTQNKLSNEAVKIGKKYILPRVTNTSARFQIKRRLGQI